MPARDAEEIYAKCSESIRKGFSRVVRVLGREPDLIYGSGARLICTPKDVNQVDLNVILVSKKNEKLLFQSPDEKNTLVVLKLREDINPMTEYPSTKESLLPVGAVLAFHAKPLTREGEELVRRVVSRMREEDRKLVARAMIYEAYELAKNAKRPKDLTRAFCDLLPYGLKWLEDAGDIPSLYQETISDVMPDSRLLSLCIRSLKLKAGRSTEKLDDVKRDGLAYLAALKPEKYRKDYFELKRKMRKWPTQFKEPVKVNF